MYKTVYLDPPYYEKGGGVIKRGADRHYPLMKTKDIITLLQKDIVPLIDENAHCYCWVTNNFLKDGIQVLESMGFRYVTIITWAKDRIGLGKYFRGQTEHILFGVKGKVPYKIIEGIQAQGKTLVSAPRTEHSKKPHVFYELIEKVSYGPFLEVFARNTREGWTSYGNEVNKNEHCGTL